MLTSTYVDIKSFSYPIGSTPAGDLLRDLRPGEEPVEILTLGCGDVRNILFALWSQQHNTCKLNFTACDLDPAVLGKHASISMIFKYRCEKLRCFWTDRFVFRRLNCSNPIRSWPDTDLVRSPQCVPSYSYRSTSIFRRDRTSVENILPLPRYKHRPRIHPEALQQAPDSIGEHIYMEQLTFRIVSQVF
jgi:hypothetical protein